MTIGYPLLNGASSNMTRRIVNVHSVLTLCDVNIVEYQLLCRVCTVVHY